MKALTVIALGVLAVAAASDNVEVLDDASFEALIASGNPAFIKFYAPWCGHCKRLAPVWDTLADHVASGPLGTSGKGVRIAKVDCTVHGTLCSANNVRGYPTLLFFKGGEREGTKYSGGRDQASLVTFIEEQVA